jgi:hypothetical protein
MQRVMNTFHSKTLQHFVRERIIYSFEKSAVDRKGLGELLTSLVQQKLLTLTQFAAGLGELVEIADNLVTDLPELWDFLGEVLGKSLYPIILILNNLT